MSEQKFEKQVREAMDEFSLDPTAPVWHKIAAEIRRKKERRRLLFWLLPLALISSMITWWALSKNETASNITSQKTETENITKKPLDNLNTTPVPRNENKTATSISDKEKLKIKKEKPTNSLTTNTFEKNNSFPTVAMKKKKAQKNNFHSRQIITKRKKENLLAAEKLSSKESRLQDSITKTENPIINIPAAGQTKDLDRVQKTDTIREEKKSEEKLADTAKAVEKINEQKPPNKKNRKLQVGAIVQVGYSGITSGLFDGFGQKSSRDFAPSSPLQSGPGGGVNLPPSNIKRSLAFSLGFSIRKKTSNRSSISSGLQYQYASTEINIGTRASRDSMFTSISRNTISYYRNDNQSKPYTNQFHFITIPISFQYQLFKKLPLHLGAGLSLSQLISSNALHYNSSANIYYKDNSLLNKTQAGLFTSLKYKFLSKKKISLDIGPQINYNMTPLLKNGSSKKQHLYFIGLNTQVNF